jgi:hypothetical protein
MNEDGDPPPERKPKSMFALARSLVREIRAENPSWSRPPHPRNWNGFGDANDEADARSFTVELAPTAGPVFERVRHELKVSDEGDGDPGWLLAPWLKWDAQRGKVAVYLGHDLIGHLADDDSAALGDAVKASSKHPVANLWLSTSGGTRSWVFVP